MYKRVLALFYTAAFCLASFAAPAIPPHLEALARTLTQKLAAREYASVETYFDETMSSGLPADKLGVTWESLIGQAGVFQSIDGTSTQEIQGYQIVLVTAKFQKTTLNLKWVFDAKSQVVGFFIVPVQAAASWTPPAYAKPTSFHEQAIMVGAKPWQLHGTLTLPNGTGPFPAVVLVAGSGPEDQDESTATNKPFKDIAWGLASRKVAVIRYNKRTQEHGKELQAHMVGFTVNEESVDDARAAVALLAKQPEIDARQIFVLGHSMGGTLAPRIAQGDQEVAGLVILAGTTRQLERVVVDQLKYIAGLQGQITPEAQKQIDDAERSAREIESSTLAADTKLDILGSPIPGSYFLDLRNYHPAAVAAQLKIPMLILRGDHDYQVTAEDMNGWRNALSGKPNVTWKVYPGLYHLFMASSSPGTGLGTPADYQKPGHVEQAVIEDIASWVETPQKI
ncbi:MAG TPA: alpha/beta fold hydrolase [Acidobacteriaceae bacterium]